MNELDFVLEYLPINIKKTISIYLDNENNNIFSKNNINYAKYNCTEYNKLNDIYESKTEYNNLNDIYESKTIYNKLNDICELKTESQKAPNNTELVEEIRLRSNKPLILKIGQETIVMEYIITQQELLQTFDKICENSIYSYKRQICEGYITIKGGNRVGIVGSGVIENGQVINVNYISSLNFRIARQKIGCSNQLIENLIDLKKGSIYNTLIISPPRRRKNNIIKRYN